MACCKNTDLVGPGPRSPWMMDCERNRQRLVVDWEGWRTPMDRCEAFVSRCT